MTTMLLTVAEAADGLRLSVRTTWRLIRDGKLHVVYPSPRRPRVRQSDLAAFVAGLADPPAPTVRPCPTSARILPFCGSHTEARAASALDDLLAPPTVAKRKPSKRNGSSKSISSKSGGNRRPGVGMK